MADSPINHPTYLVNGSLTELPTYPRPNNSDENARLIASQKMALRLNEWYEDEEPFPNDKEKEHTTKQSVDFFMYASRYGQIDMNGFTLAKNLCDKVYCEGDSSLVDLMDDAFVIFSNEVWKAVEKWVQNCKITPTLRDGDKVTYVKKNYRFEKGVILEGEINGIYEKTARYIVRIPSEGHVRKDDKTFQSSKSFGYVVNYEEVEIANIRSLTGIRKTLYMAEGFTEDKMDCWDS